MLKMAAGKGVLRELRLELLDRPVAAVIAGVFDDRLPLTSSRQSGTLSSLQKSRKAERTINRTTRAVRILAGAGKLSRQRRRNAQYS